MRKTRKLKLVLLPPRLEQIITNPIHDNSSEWLDSTLNQFIVFGQKKEPFNCARCGAGTDDTSQSFCHCTDPDSSASADSPNWIEDINYPRYIEAKGKATQAILNHISDELAKARAAEADRAVKLWAKLGGRDVFAEKMTDRIVELQAQLNSKEQV